MYTLVATKCWPMETRLPRGDQWKAEKLGVFKRWPITRCFIKGDRAVLFIEHSINFRLNGEHWRAVQLLFRVFEIESQILLSEVFADRNCTARQCSPLRRKFMECSINSPALSLLMKHLVTGQRLQTPNFSAFHWSPRGSLVSIGQHFVASRVVHLPKST